MRHPEREGVDAQRGPHADAQPPEKVGDAERAVVDAVAVERRVPVRDERCGFGFGFGFAVVVVVGRGAVDADTGSQ